MNPTILHLPRYRPLLFCWARVCFVIMLLLTAPVASPRLFSAFLPGTTTALAQAPTFDCTAVTEIPQSECEALVAFYASTNGANWLDNTNWLQTTTPCRNDNTPPSNPAGWLGVGCLFGNVWDITLESNRLTGTLPPDLANLNSLSTLNLSHNQLSGGLPRELGNLTQLSLLNLGDNRFSGRIPVELGNLTNAILLNLATNYFSGPIPVELGNLALLKVLYLHENRLQGAIPTQLGNLQQLTTLRLNTNQLSGAIPTSLTDLALIDFLDLSENQLTGPIPPGLEKLTQLTYLGLDNNALSGPIPPALGTLRYLEDLTLDHNQLSGAIPAELGNLTNVKVLFLHNNQLSGPLPATLGNLRYLTVLLLNSNGLSGTIPPTLGQLTNLRELTLAKNQLSGAIPPELGQLDNLQVLQLQYNDLSGPLPPELGNLTQLQWLLLQSNTLTGTVPSELGNLIQLTDLDLGENGLTGAIPATLGNLTELRMLDLRQNRLSGAVPAELGKLVKLRYYYLQDNALQGALPAGMVNLRDLEELNLDHNGLYAPLPSLQELLDAKAPGWSATQTLAPTNLVAHQQSNSAIALTWTPIAYTLDGGFYEVSYATDPAGPFTVHGQTPTKRSTAYTVAGLEPATTYHFRVRTYTPAHHEQQNELWSGYTLIVNATTATPGVGDVFESDDTCPAARTVALDGRLLDHTFHQPGDVDWLRFNGQAGVTYRIDVQLPAGSPADIAISLYTDCAGEPTAQQNESFSSGVRLDFQPPQAGPLWVRVANSDAQVGSDQHSYRVAVRALGEETHQGAVILVAGRLVDGDPRQANVNNVADTAYTLFRNNGYHEEAIRYLAANATLPGVDDDATTTLLRDAIVSWALDKVTPQQALTLYLIGHGEPGRFSLNEATRNAVTVAELSDWLTQLEESIPGVPVNVIIDAPYAGSFINGDPTLSKPGRVILTATNASLRAFASQEGLHFSDHLLTALRQGHHLFGAFWETRTALFTSHRSLNGDMWQEPWLEADGDAIPNEVEDALQASLRSFAGPATAAAADLWAPTVTDARLIENILQVKVSDNREAPVRVWALIYTPTYTPPLTGAGFIPEDPTTDPALALVELQPSGSGRYVAGLHPLNLEGRQRFVIYAQDSDQLQARPLEVTEVLRITPLDKAVYLPVTMR